MNCFICHGSLSNPFGNWFGSLYKKLGEDKRGKIDTYVPHFPFNEKQNYNNWSAVLDGYNKAGLINSETVFVAHSLAPIFVIRYLIEHNIKVKAIISVCGFNKLIGGELDEVNKSFFIDYSSLPKIKQLTKKIICYYSDNDPYIELKELKKFSTAVGGEIHLIKGGKHLNAEAGKLSFDEIADNIYKL